MRGKSRLDDFPKSFFFVLAYVVGVMREKDAISKGGQKVGRLRNFTRIP